MSSLKNGLALGSGAALGLAHIGVIHALEEMGYRPAVIAGTSIGALVGAVLVNLGKDWISSAWPDAWLYLMGLVFILVVVATPRGLAGMVESLRARLKPKAPEPAATPTQLSKAEVTHV